MIVMLVLQHEPANTERIVHGMAHPAMLGMTIAPHEKKWCTDKYATKTMKCQCPKLVSLNILK
jgi:hypothetical protein